MLANQSTAKEKSNVTSDQNHNKGDTSSPLQQIPGLQGIRVNVQMNYALALQGKTQVDSSMGEGMVSHAWEITNNYSSKGKIRLDYHEPSFSLDKGKFVVKLPQEVIDEGISKWVRALWGVKGTLSMSMQNQVYNLKFGDLEERDKVIEEGPWHIGEKYFMVQKWKAFSDIDVSKLNTIPIWVKFFNLPKHYWSSKALSYIASAIGKPLCLDNATEHQARMSFAKVCIEVTPDHTLPASILVDKGDGVLTEISIEYPWKPPCCEECNVFGHYTNRCGKAKKTENKKAEIQAQVWKKKAEQSLKKGTTEMNGEMKTDEVEHSKELDRAESLDKEIVVNVEVCRSFERASYGGIIRLKNGFPVLAFNGLVDKSFDSNEIATVAICEGVTIMNSLGIKWFEIITSSVYAKGVINRIWKPPWKCLTQVRQTLKLLHTVEEFVCSHTYKDGNKAAHYIASDLSFAESCIVFPQDFNVDLDSICTADVI
ncbi:hypothetical protein GIB67_035143 [Kingdonia uniflora]|uniref:RNase H type-1 domain-containing protein n=1 Tax=Kingdonia uniflora TaxID=39325 RepID=A0A7J7LDH6_9MAGN|nr:hypothetical protein GIB67_035143 [Kingdonia uniflora]